MHAKLYNATFTMMGLLLTGELKPAGQLSEFPTEGKF